MIDLIQLSELRQQGQKQPQVPATAGKLSTPVAKAISAQDDSFVGGMIFKAGGRTSKAGAIAPAFDVCWECDQP
jgi:pyridoxal biosynthesis lyase PdxS